jgi:hypothetical protein
MVRLRSSLALGLLALGLALPLGGCVVYPGGGGYAYEPAPVVYSAPVYVGGGWGHGHHHHHRGW